MPQCGQGRLRFMLYQIVSFLLDVVAGLLGGACLLRIYMQWQRVPFNNPVGRLVFALSDWMVLPLRRVVQRRQLGSRRCALSADVHRRPQRHPRDIHPAVGVARKFGHGRVVHLLIEVESRLMTCL